MPHLLSPHPLPHQGRRGWSETLHRKLKVSKQTSLWILLWVRQETFFRFDIFHRVKSRRKGAKKANLVTTNHLRKQLWRELPIWLTLHNRGHEQPTKILKDRPFLLSVCVLFSSLLLLPSTPPQFKYSYQIHDYHDLHKVWTLGPSSSSLYHDVSFSTTSHMVG